MRENGIKCGHESHINFNGVRRGFIFSAESSWLAVPFLTSAPEDYYIIRTLRDPFRVIKSFYELSVFSSLSSPYYKFIKSNLSGSIVDIDFGLKEQEQDHQELQNISNYYIGWNKLFDMNIGNKNHATICFEKIIDKSEITIAGNIFKVPKSVVNDKKGSKARYIEIEKIKNILGTKRCNQLQEYYNLHKGI